MYESYSHVDGIPFNYISYGTDTKFTVDLIDSCVATMNPALITYAKVQGKFKHKRKHYYPFQEDIGTFCYGEYSIERERVVPKKAIIKYYRRAYDTEFINTLRSLENIFKGIVSKYQEGWCVNRKGVVVSNYVSSFASNKPLSDSKEINELLPYISYIQDKYGDYTFECKQDDYYNEELDVHIRIQINSDSLKTNNKPPLEAFKLVKWFIEINTTGQVPKELMERIEQEEAIEMLGN